MRVEDYGPGTIRPHERTHPGPKEDRLRLTRATNANLSPIFSLYSDADGAVREALGTVLQSEPELFAEGVGRTAQRRAMAQQRRRAVSRVTAAWRISSPARNWRWEGPLGWPRGLE